MVPLLRFLLVGIHSLHRHVLKVSPKMALPFYLSDAATWTVLAATALLLYNLSRVGMRPKDYPPGLALWHQFERRHSALTLVNRSSYTPINRQLAPISPKRYPSSVPEVDRRM